MENDEDDDDNDSYDSEDKEAGRWCRGRPASQRQAAVTWQAGPAATKQTGGNMASRQPLFSCAAMFEQADDDVAGMRHEASIGSPGGVKEEKIF